MDRDAAQILIAAVALVCGILMPFSGGWLFLIPAALIVRGTRGVERQVT